MKHLLTVAVLLLALTCCTTEADRIRMRAGLDSINMRNRNDLPFTVSDVQPYVDFFDEQGTSNDRLLAHYLLGRAYHEHGEAPMALQCYQDAADCADTLNADCDYPQLARVYGQMAQVFYEHGLYRQQLHYERMAEKSAWTGNDTIAAIMNKEQEGLAYEGLGDKDSAINVFEEVSDYYKRLGYNSDAAISLGGTIKLLLSGGEYEKAYNYMKKYEYQSGLFDKRGNIEEGREIYYYIKGQYFLSVGILDSAENFFRKELLIGKDFENQHAASLGLAELYHKLHFSDSAAKFYKYAYAMSDSLYGHRATKEVERIQSMYDYTRHQEIARQEQERANEERHIRNYLVFFLCIIIFACIFVGVIIIKKRKDRLEEYKRLTKELDEAIVEKEALYKHQSEYEEIIAAKNIHIAEIERKKALYAKMTYFNTAIAEKCLKESPTYKTIADKAIKGIFLTDDDYSKVNILIKEYLPGFDDLLTTKRHLLKEDEYHICMLLRLHFRPVDITGMLGLSKSQVSQLSTNIMNILFKSKGSSKDLSSTLGKVF